MIQRLFASIALLLWPMQALAVDSYRFLHVTIDTPWFIFVFLFFLVFAPMILMVILYWKYAFGTKKDEGKERAEEAEGEKKS